MEKWLAKIKKIKHIEIYGAVVVIAIMLLIFFSGFGGTNDTGAKGTSATANAGIYTSDELRLANILSQIEGVGRATVMKTDKGVVVIAAGADDPNVRFRILRAVQTLLNDNSVRIEILCSK